MSQPSVSPFGAALQVFQQGISVLAAWVNLSDRVPLPDAKIQAVQRALSLLSWPPIPTLGPLRVLFDRVNLKFGQSQTFYWKAQEIAKKDPPIPYPQSSESDFDNLKNNIKEAIGNLESSDWDNLALLTLIVEKFGSFVSFGEADVALTDIIRSAAAVAAAIAHDPDATHLRLVAGDLSGIQKFIYTISSDGALKSLRARSFYLELVTEEVVQQLLTALDLPRTNVIYAGGGNLYILAPDTDECQGAIASVGQQVNQWLLKQFQGKVFLALDSLAFPIEDIKGKEFADHWSLATKQLATHKSRKFAPQIDDLLSPQDAYEPCGVCHRDDVQILRPLNDKEPDSVLACGTCRRMFDLGGQLLRVEAIVRSAQQNIPGKSHTISFKLPQTADRPATEVYYHLFKHWKQVLRDADMVLLVNDWDLAHYKFRQFNNPVPLLLGNYAGESAAEPGVTMSASEMTEKAQGINRVGYLRMDVDRLGQIFAKGLGDRQTLPRLAGLSRMLSYFFKVYLNSLAASRQENIPDDSCFYNIKCLSKGTRPNLLFIYAGGDDLFVSGAWNEVVEFGLDVYQCFRAYTGNNPDITLSAGICIAGGKFPLYQGATKSGEAEEEAKNNGRDSLGLFEQVFKWDEWLGMEDFARIDPDIQDYLREEAKPELLGILPFVRRLDAQKMDINYARSFLRNLLQTAQLQEKWLEQAKAQSPKDRRDIRYFLHLPQIAYTLARLPESVRNHQDFSPVSTSLKNPYNAPYFRAIATWLELLNRS